jgi:Protein of unknown function (DUF3007)
MKAENLFHRLSVLIATCWVLSRSAEAFTVIRRCSSVSPLQQTQTRSSSIEDNHDRSRSPYGVTPHKIRLDYHGPSTASINVVSLHMSSSPEEGKSDNKPFFLDPGTKGGALFYMTALFVIPYLVYQVLVASGMDEIQTGIVIGVGFTILSTLIWSSTYLFRVATKDMTYVRQDRLCIVCLVSF